MSTTKPSPGERIAAMLRKSPIYVDPSLASALPPAKRATLLAAIRRSPIPVYVLLVPLVKGGVWDDPQQLARVVHDRLGRDGAYVTLDEKFGDGLNAYQWGGADDPQGSVGGNTWYAAAAVGMQRELDGKPITERLIRCVELIAGGQGIAEFRKAAAPNHLNSPSPSPGRSHPGSVALPLGVAGAVAVAGVAGLLGWRHRRLTAVRRASAGLVPSPRRVFTTARRASEDELRAQAARELVDLGELLDTSEVDITTSSERVQALMTAALDAYQAAGKVLDAARGIPDLAGVLVLVDQGLDALAAARSATDGHAEPRPSPLCFFNPLHGNAVPGTISWRLIGTRRRLRIAACRACTTAIKDKETPETLMDGDVPYFEADPENSIWAETGYGQFRDDLVQRVLRGDFHHGG
ncbi:MAG: hypothetical protein JWN52_4820 [Actinomycetia bacterium]|nr:hypothetical protein [Actinomycetes bacterium]